jgi:Flp pilus assembly protein TadD
MTAEPFLLVPRACPMTSSAPEAIQQTRQTMLLQQASGYVELAELLVTPEAPAPASAARLFRRALAVLDELPDSAQDHGDVLVLRAEALRALGSFAEALPLFQCVAARQPTAVAAWLGLGWCLKRLGRLPEAIRALTRGLAACGDEPVLAYNLSCYHSLAGNVLAAIEFLTKAIASDDRFRALTTVEPDFDPIRNDPRFVAVIDQAV